MMIVGGFWWLEKGKHCINFEEGQEGDFGDYKLINLTSLSGKVIEQIFLEGVPSHKKENVIGNSKHGFMRSYVPDQINLITPLYEITGPVIKEGAEDV